MDKPSSVHDEGEFQPLMIVLLMVCASLSGCILASDDVDVNVTAVFITHQKTIFEPVTVFKLDASSSLPQDGSLTYSWDCDGDGATDKTGQKCHVVGIRRHIQRNIDRSIRQ